MCWRCNVCNHSCSGSSFAEVAGRLLQLGGGPALVLRLLLARATRDLGSEVPDIMHLLELCKIVAAPHLQKRWLLVVEAEMPA